MRKALASGAGVAILAVVSVVSAVQRMLGLEPPRRALTRAELAILQPIFAGSVDFAAVSITEGDLGILNGPQRRAYTIGNRILVPAASRSYPLAAHAATLVHEMTHVWQFQNGGPAYAPEALCAQLTAAGYAFDGACAGGKHWEELNPEQQAAFVEAAFVCNVDFANPAAGPSMIVAGVNYTVELVRALGVIRARQAEA